MAPRPLDLARSTHPGPALAVTAVTAILGASSGLGAGRTILLAAAVLANQLSVGLSNDWLDADRDRASGRRDKPVAAGAVSERAAASAAFLAAAAAIALTVPLGAGATAAHALFLASAWSYNLGLKRTPLSALPYLVSFGVLPAIVTLARARPEPPAWWALAAGALLGLAAHFANVLPDLEDDARTGVRGLPHRLGRRGSLVAAELSLAGASAVVVLGSATPGWLVVGGLVPVGAVVAAGLVVGLARPGTRALFRLIMVGAVLDVALLALHGTRIAA